MARTKLKTAALVDHLIHLINMHEANRLIVYSPLLSDQIPRSHAANAFNVFQDASLKFEIIRHSILWDPCRKERNNSTSKIWRWTPPSFLLRRHRWRIATGNKRPNNALESLKEDCQKKCRGVVERLLLRGSSLNCRNVKEQSGYAPCLLSDSP